MVLAAGFGTRLGRPKATVECGGITLAARAVMRLRTAGCETVVGVVGPGYRYWRGVTDFFDIVVVNERPEAGQGVSVVLGVQRARHASGVVLMPVDTALVTSATIAVLLNRYGTGNFHVVKPVFMAGVDTPW